MGKKGRLIFSGALSKNICDEAILLLSDAGKRETLRKLKSFFYKEISFCVLIAFFRLYFERKETWGNCVVRIY